MFAEGLVVHEEIADVAVAVDVVHPGGESFGAERPFLPVAIPESEGDVVGKLVVLQQEVDRAFRHRLGLSLEAGRRVDVVRRPELQQPIHAFAEDGPVLATLGDVPREVVVVHELGVAEDRGRLAEEFLDLVAMGVDLAIELVMAEEEARGVVARLTDELAGTGVRELLEEIDDVGGPLFELLEADPADRVADPEPALVSPDEIEDLPRGGSVALVRDLEHDLAVGLLVEVERVRVEDGVPAETEGLMDLEVEADRCHGRR